MPYKKMLLLVSICMINPLSAAGQLRAISKPHVKPAPVYVDAATVAIALMHVTRAIDSLEYLGETLANWIKRWPGYICAVRIQRFAKSLADLRAFRVTLEANLHTTTVTWYAEQRPTYLAILEATRICPDADARVAKSHLCGCALDSACAKSYALIARVVRDVQPKE